MCFSCGLTRVRNAFQLYKTIRLPVYSVPTLYRRPKNPELPSRCSRGLPCQDVMLMGGQGAGGENKTRFLVQARTENKEKKSPNRSAPSLTGNAPQQRSGPSLMFRSARSQRRSISQRVEREVGERAGRPTGRLHMHANDSAPLSDHPLPPTTGWKCTTHLRVATHP